VEKGVHRVSVPWKEEKRESIGDRIIHEMFPNLYTNKRTFFPHPSESAIHWSRMIHDTVRNNLAGSTMSTDY